MCVKFCLTTFRLRSLAYNVGKYTWFPTDEKYTWLPTDALVLKQQDISIHSNDYIFILLNQFQRKILHVEWTKLENQIIFWRNTHLFKNYTCFPCYVPPRFCYIYTGWMHTWFLKWPYERHFVEICNARHHKEDEACGSSICKFHPALYNVCKYVSMWGSMIN